MLLDAPIKDVTQSIDPANGTWKQRFEFENEGHQRNTKLGDSTFFTREVYGDNSVQIADCGFFGPLVIWLLLVSGEPASVFGNRRSGKASSM